METNGVKVNKGNKVLYVRIGLALVHKEAAYVGWTVTLYHDPVLPSNICSTAVLYVTITPNRTSLINYLSVKTQAVYLSAILQCKDRLSIGYSID